MALSCRRLSIIAASLVLVFGGRCLCADAPVSFSRDIRPILSDTCFTCHGPSEDSREAELRLDTEEGTLAELPSGETAVVPGSSDDSAVYQRIATDDEDMIMPPADSDKQLSAEQIALIQRWIDQGAEYTGHWAFIEPERGEAPEVKHEQAVRNPIDRFVLARLEQEGIGPAPQADKATLIRRVTLDLTGLPPTIAEVDAFLADESVDAYEKLVDRLLASPRYGEQMTRYWLDAARYGDTHGLHLDNERSIWPYRDWVIKALNQNMPFDQFTIQQLAGDLLPDATLDQRIATGFIRAHVTTSEGGSIDEEYYVRYAVDRVETMGTVWMGMSLGCAVCHEHKFDPVSQTEFYQLFAFFNSTTDRAMDGNALLPAPTVRVPTPEYEQQKADLNAQYAQIDARIQQELAKINYVDPKPESTSPTGPAEVVWIDDAVPAGAKAEGDTPWQFVTAPDHPVHSGTAASTRSATGRSQHFFTGASAPLRVGQGDKLFTYVYLDPQNPPREIMLQFNDGTWEHRAIWGEDVIDWGQAGTASRQPMGPLPEAGKWVRLEVDVAKVGLPPGAMINGWAFTQFDGTVYWDRAGIVTTTPQDGAQFNSLVVWEGIQRGLDKPSLPADVAVAVKADPAQRTPEQTQAIRDYFLENVHSGSRIIFDPLHTQSETLAKQIQDLDKTMPSTMVAQELPKPRDAFFLNRGEYDKKGDKVERDVPAVFPPLPEGAPRNRLGLAQWLVDPSHPLTARVTVNRYWQQYFGVGLVKTAEDFGSQGQWPSHPALLDWLACEFVASGWDVKHIQRLIVTSGTYRQDARFGPDRLPEDRENILLARGPRYRMDAEMVRDNALAISGLLVEKIGGRSVRPYQPSGIWKAVAYTSSNTANFKKDSGESLYRRSMYTFWKRTAPPPTMLLLDAPSRETCTVRRARTNTPLAALALLNDVQFFEAARKLGERAAREGGATLDEQIAFAFRLATARRPDAEELDVLRGQYEAHLAEFHNDAEAAGKVLGVGDSPRDDAIDTAQAAAWTMVANVILNLDETVTKQ